MGSRMHPMVEQAVKKWNRREVNSCL
jgi:hypothetical protein